LSNIHYITPYSTEKNFGKAINEQIECVPDDAWVCLMDGDVMFLTPEWGQQISEVVKLYGKKYSLLGCMTNRLARPIQRYKGEFSNDMDIMNHYEIAKQLQTGHWAEVEDITLKRRIAGMFMLFPKSLWNQVKFRENTPNFDDYFCSDVLRKGKRLGLIKGLYMFHFYRANKSPKDRSHLINSTPSTSGTSSNITSES